MDPMNVLEVIGVTKHFGDLIALKDVTFTIREGEIFGLIGPNGAGKTTLVNVISGIVPYSNGDIRFLGKSIRSLKAHKIGALGISRTFELGSPAIQRTALENVMVGALFGYNERERSGGAARRKAMETLDFFGLVAKKDMPAGSLNVLERKRLEMAIALAMNPRLLMLDEAMSGLNPVEIGRAVEIIRMIRDEGVTILVIEHVMRAITTVSDRLLVLHHGEKIIEGPVNTVLKNAEVIEAYLGSRHRDVMSMNRFPPSTK
jgi:branched-chain amino acid transport system ATP-binding protein